MEGDQEIDRRRRNGGCQDNEWHLREYSVNNHLRKKSCVHMNQNCSYDKTL